VKRLLGILGAILLTALFLVPFVSAADTPTRDDAVYIAFAGDVTVAADEYAAAVVVTGGQATILGEVGTLVTIDGTADLQGGTVDTVVAIASAVTVGSGSTVTGDIYGLDADVTTASDATIVGETRDMTTQFIGAATVLAPAFLLFFIGVGLVTIVAGLVLAAIAARQVRSAEALIAREPGQVLLVGIGGLVVPLLVSIALMLTVVGAPLGVAILLFAWPAVAYVGYLVAGIFVGEWVLARLRPGPQPERPYLASVVGLLLLQVASIIPLLTAVASIFGYGAVLLLAWRVFRSGSASDTTVRGVTPTTPQPMPS
jgi:hypothetical protein